MELLLKRDVFTEVSTQGQLSVNGEFECFTLEDKDRKLENGGTKVFGETAIPRDRYKVELDWSPHFGKDMPHILDVPQFEGVRIHPGNYPRDTEGCILVGKERYEDFIRDSKIAFDALLAKLNLAWAQGEEVWLTID